MKEGETVSKVGKYLYILKICIFIYIKYIYLYIYIFYIYIYIVFCVFAQRKTRNREQRMGWKQDFV